MGTRLKFRRTTRSIWAWTGTLGMLLIAVGVAVLCVSSLATIAISWLLGLGLVVGGLVQLFHAFQFGRPPRTWVRLLIAVFSVMAGGGILRDPALGAISITLLLGFYLFFGAVAKAMLAFEGNPVTGRGWLIFSAIASLFLGACLVATFPVTSMVIPGTLLGCDLIFYGICLTVIAGRLRRGELTVDSFPLRKAS